MLREIIFHVFLTHEIQSDLIHIFVWFKILNLWQWLILK